MTRICSRTVRKIGNYIWLFPRFVSSAVIPEWLVGYRQSTGKPFQGRCRHGPINAACWTLAN